MCTAATPKTRVFYMGRTLDYEFSFGEEITIVPRNFVFNFKSEKCESHYAIIGMAHIANGFPPLLRCRKRKGAAFRLSGTRSRGDAYSRHPYISAENGVQPLKYSLTAFFQKQKTFIL